MANPDPEIVRKVTHWLGFADEDLKLASNVMDLQAEDTPYRLIAYHAQQCAEKCLKAFLVYHKVDFPYTHSIGRLLRLCGDLAAWPQTLKDAKELTPYAVTARYPGEDEEVTKAEALRAVELAQQVRTVVRSDLQKLGLQIPQ